MSQKETTSSDATLANENRLLRAKVDVAEGRATVLRAALRLAEPHVLAAAAEEIAGAERAWEVVNALLSSTAAEGADVDPQSMAVPQVRFELVKKGIDGDLFHLVSKYGSGLNSQDINRLHVALLDTCAVFLAGVSDRQKNGSRAGTQS